MLGGVCASAPYRGSVRVAFFWWDCGEEGVFCLVVVLQAWVLLLPGFWRLSEVVWYGIPRSLGFRQIGWRVPVPCSFLVRWTILDHGARVAKNGSWDLVGTRYSGTQDSADNSCGSGVSYGMSLILR